jgi:hypothetical protein
MGSDLVVIPPESSSSSRRTATTIVTMSKKTSDDTTEEDDDDHDRMPVAAERTKTKTTAMSKKPRTVLEVGWYRTLPDDRGFRYVAAGRLGACGRWSLGGAVSMGMDASEGVDRVLRILAALSAPGPTAPPPVVTVALDADAGHAAATLRLLALSPSVVGVCFDLAVVRSLPRNLPPPPAVTAVDGGRYADLIAVLLRNRNRAPKNRGTPTPPPSRVELPPVDAASVTDGDVPDGDGGVAFAHAFYLSFRGGRSDTVRVGRFRDAATGVWCDAIEKSVDFAEDGNLCLIQATRRGRVRDASDDPDAATAAAALRMCRPLHNLALLRDMGAESTGVVRVLHFERRGGTLVAYYPWYRAGNAAEARACGRFSRPERARILQGPWAGLRWLHGTVLHGDIKPANVFIDHRDGRWVGVLGDLDDAVSRSAYADPDLYCPDVKSTPYYGAPHAHGDPRRDQVALMVTTIEFLSNLDWFRQCERVLKATTLTDAERYLWGYATDGSGRPTAWLHWVTGVYAAYAKAVRSLGAGPDLAALAGALQTLDEAPDERWNYDAVDGLAVSALRSIAGDPATAAEPPPTVPTFPSLTPPRTPPPSAKRARTMTMTEDG